MYAGKRIKLAEQDMPRRFKRSPYLATRRDVDTYTCGLEERKKSIKKRIYESERGAQIIRRKMSKKGEEYLQEIASRLTSPTNSRAASRAASCTSHKSGVSLGSCAGRKKQKELAEKFVKIYEMGAEVKKTDHCTVKSCVNMSTGAEYHVNVVGKHKVRDLAHTRQALHLWKQCDHPNIQKLRNNYESNESLFQIVDPSYGGTLADAVANKLILSEQDCAKVVRDICGALFYLHAKGIVHCGVRPENILFDADDSKMPMLTNFEEATIGNACVYDPFECKSDVFFAPEITDNKKFSVEVDIWGLGITMYTLLLGFEPCHPKKFDHHAWGDVSEAAKDLIEKMVKISSDERCTAVDVLSHPWIVTTGAPGDEDPGVLAKTCAARRKELESVAQGLKISTLKQKKK